MMDFDSQIIESKSPLIMRLEELDGLRGVLALWVVISHIFCWTGYWSPSLSGPMLKLWGEFISGASAVDTFMILSGFAISFLIHNRSPSYGRFLIGRAFRIYPAYLVCLAIGIAVMHLTPFVLRSAPWRDSIYFEWNRSISASESLHPATHALWHITLLNGLIPRTLLQDATATILAPAWSITLEWQFYLVAPLLARAVRLSGGLPMVAILVWIGARYGEQWRNPHLAFLPAQLPLFLIGIGSYHLYSLACSWPTQRSRIFVLYASVLIAAALICHWRPVSLIVWAVSFGCIFARGTDYFSSLLKLARRFLLHPLLQWTGNISFPLYLVHWPIIIALLSFILQRDPSISSRSALGLLLVLGLSIILSVAFVLHILVEKPMIAVGKRFAFRLIDERKAASTNTA